MIDSPGGNRDVMDRGYDFPGVVRWMAQRADIVCIFFDPDKPGTTGETMSVLLDSLSGMDHKLLIVLNKADQFRKIHDFARAYGSLCWNLSKVIPRKDLPPIFTMSLPNEGSPKSSLSGSLSDLEHTRDDVVDQVMQAPKRRIDNVITNLYDSTSMLIMYSKIWNDVLSRYNREWRSLRLKEAGLTTASTLALCGMNYLALDATLQAGVLGSSIIGIGGLVWFHQSVLNRVQEDLTSVESLSTSFQRTHVRQVQDGDEYVASLWQRARNSLRSALSSAFENGGTLPTVAAFELQKLENILDKDIPRLRRLANETQLGSTRSVKPM
jgi:hypothetical protein